MPVLSASVGHMNRGYRVSLSRNILSHGTSSRPSVLLARVKNRWSAPAISIQARCVVEGRLFHRPFRYDGVTVGSFWPPRNIVGMCRLPRLSPPPGAPGERLHADDDEAERGQSRP